MLTQISLQLAVEYCKSYAHLHGYQDPNKVVDAAKVFMAYLQSNEDNSAKESLSKTINRNPSKSGNS